MANPHLIEIPIAQLRPYPGNARTRTTQHIRQIADSFETFEFLNPVLIDANNNIVAGVGRVEAADLLGWQAVPTLLITDLTKAQLRAYRIADNRLEFG